MLRLLACLPRADGFSCAASCPAFTSQQGWLPRKLSNLTAPPNPLQHRPHPQAALTALEAIVRKDGSRVDPAVLQSGGWAGCAKRLWSRPAAAACTPHEGDIAGMWEGPPRARTILPMSTADAL